MALRHSAFYAPLLVTMSGGYLKQQGLEHQYEVATPTRTIPKSIAEGSVQVAQSAVATSWMMREKGEAPPYVHFAQINERDGFFLAGRKQEDNFRWQMLEGKTVLVDHLFQPLAMFQSVLRQHGVDLGKVNIIDAGDVAAMDKAFRSGTGDYVHQQGPAPQQLQHDGVGYLVASIGLAIGPVAFSSLCARREWLHTAEAQSFMRAYTEARGYVQQAAAEEVAALVSGYLAGIDQSVLVQTIRDYQQLGTWTGGVAITRESYAAAQEVFIGVGMQKISYAYEEVIAAPPTV